MNKTIPIRKRSKKELEAFKEGYQMGVESAVFAIRSNADRFLDLIDELERLPENDS